LILLPKEARQIINEICPLVVPAGMFCLQEPGNGGRSVGKRKILRKHVGNVAFL